MRCLYCDKEIKKITIGSFLIRQDGLCLECREGMRVKRKKIKIHGLQVETFFEYDSLFRSILLQYKECCDEALKDVFLHDLREYIFFRYHGYQIVPVPSSAKKLEERGFSHLELIFEGTGLRINSGLKMKEELIQQGKSASERKKMIHNYYYEGEHIDKALVVDDVLTTGSSLLGAYNALLGKTDRIRFLVLGI